MEGEKTYKRIHCRVNVSKDKDKSQIRQHWKLKNGDIGDRGVKIEWNCSWNWMKLAEGARVRCFCMENTPGGRTARCGRREQMRKSAQPCCRVLFCFALLCYGFNHKRSILVYWIIAAHTWHTNIDKGE